MRELRLLSGSASWSGAGAVLMIYTTPRSLVSQNGAPRLQFDPISSVFVPGLSSGGLTPKLLDGELHLRSPQAGSFAGPCGGPLRRGAAKTQAGAAELLRAVAEASDYAREDEVGSDVNAPSKSSLP